MVLLGRNGGETMDLASRSSGYVTLHSLLSFHLELKLAEELEIPILDDREQVEPENPSFAIILTLLTHPRP